MSGLAIVSKADCVEILTDAAFTRSDSGVVQYFGPKQLQIGGAVVASSGWMDPCTAFACLASDTCADFDELVERSDAMWDSVNDALLSRTGDPGTSYMIAFVGWSERRRQLEAYSINSDENRREGSPLAALAIGPDDDCIEITQPFVDRFGCSPEQFDARRDGVALFEALRRRTKRFDAGRFACVGGYLLHTVITPAGVTNQRIHEWPGDRVGERIAA